MNPEAHGKQYSEIPRMSDAMKGPKDIGLSQIMDTPAPAAASTASKTTSKTVVLETDAKLSLMVDGQILHLQEKIQNEHFKQRQQLSEKAKLQITEEAPNELKTIEHKDDNDINIVKDIYNNDNGIVKNNTKEAENVADCGNANTSDSEDDEVSENCPGTGTGTGAGTGACTGTGSGSGTDTMSTSSVELIESTFGQTNGSGMEESQSEYRVGGYHLVAVGDIFKSRYHAIKKLGWGHFSTVWLCYDSQTERYCAIKVVKSAEHFTETARDEIRLLRAVADTDWHPLRHRLVEFRDYFYMNGIHGTHLCLVFEVLGENLLTLIQRSRYKGLPLYNVKQIARQVLEGLFYLHMQCRIIHTDLKPENVLMVADDLAIRGQATQTAGAYLQAHLHASARFRVPNGHVLFGAHSELEQESVQDGQKAKGGDSGTASTSGAVASPGHKKARSNNSKDARMTKTAKRRQRARAKRSLTFFQQHRQWLRRRAVEDLLGLAQRGLLTPSIAAMGVTGKLPFMPFTFDGLEILNDSDMDQLDKVTRGDRVGDSSRRGKRGMESTLKVPRPGPNANPTSQHDMHCSGGPSSAAVKLLISNPEQFMRRVQRKVAESDRAIMERQIIARRRRKHKSATKKRHNAGAGMGGMGMGLGAMPGAGGYFSAAGFGGGIRADIEAMKEPNLDFTSRKDPATQKCKLNVKIADMGNGCWFNHHFTDDIQTREYRAVEVILGSGYSEKADLWSAACLFWELATGDYLFYPQNGRGKASQDEEHIAKILETCGPIPQYLIDHGDYSGEIFKPNGQLRHINHLQARPMASVLMNRYHWSRKDALEFVAFLEPMLRTDPRQRVSAYTAMRHSWLLLDDEMEELEHERNGARKCERECYCDTNGMRCNRRYPDAECSSSVSRNDGMEVKFNLA
ncbi:hypothetical protein KR018_011966 [Drosophila ironensis]|nr:hypothetical protein KR018_011966 [Drosophila ironensis]